MLQGVAVFCSALLCVAVSVIEHMHRLCVCVRVCTRVHVCTTYVGVCLNVYVNVYVFAYAYAYAVRSFCCCCHQLNPVAVCCSVLLYVAVRCSVLQCDAAYAVAYCLHKHADAFPDYSLRMSNFSESLTFLVVYVSAYAYVHTAQAPFGLRKRAPVRADL